MNLLNRLLVILGTLLAMAAVSVAAIMPAETLGLLAGVFGALHGLAARLLPPGRLLVGAGGVLLNLLLLLWLWLELRRPRHRTVQVSQADGARAEVTLETLVGRLEDEVDALAGVVRAKARARSFGKTVEVTIEAEITPMTPVAVTANRIGETVREVAETAMGLRLRGQPRVRIKAIRAPEETPAPPLEPASPEPEALLEPAEPAAPEAALPEPATEKPSPPP